MIGTITKPARRDGTPARGYLFFAGRTAVGKRIQIPKSGFDRRKEAADALRKAIDHYRFDGNRTNRLTFSRFIWLDEYAKHRCTPTTLERYVTLGRHATNCAWISSDRLRRIGLALLMALVGMSGLSAFQLGSCVTGVQAGESRTTVEAPDGMWILRWKQGADREWRLSLEAAGSTKEQVVAKGFLRPQRIEWAPDSRHFFQEDHVSSDWENYYVYSVPGLKRLDLGDALIRHSSELRHAKRVGSHMYLYVNKWLTSDTLDVCVLGHTDSPAQEFMFRFNVKVKSTPSRESTTITPTEPSTRKQ